MTDLSDYMWNEHWRNMHKYSLKNSNGGFYPRWHQGDGIHGGYHVRSTPKHKLYLKQGSDNANPYHIPDEHFYCRRCMK